MGPAGEILDLEFEDLVNSDHIIDYDCEFYTSCDGCCDRSALDAECREAAFAEDQQPVEQDVDSKGDDGVVQADANNFDGSHGAEKVCEMPKTSRKR